MDEVTLACPDCGKEARRIPDVLDAWFDSGSMPFAQWGYPHTPDSRAAFERAFPADFISEAIDQTRGWFYSLLAVSTLLFDQTSYRNVVCLGHIVDRDGRKMSKSLGNVLDPFELLDRYGADPLRWFMLANGSPWVSRRLFPEAVEEITRSFFLTLWNTYSFFCLYARLEGFDPTRPAAGATATPLDRWVLAELADTVDQVTRDLDDYDATSAARRLAAFVDDLSNWYVRLSRRRFWRGTGEDADAAFRTLWTCLRTVTLLLAPYAPFTAEELWQGLVVSVDPGAPDSVHLVDWPEPDRAALDPGLSAAMAEVRRLVGLGRQARTEAKLKVRQPLARALIGVPDPVRAGVAGLLDLVAAELNVKQVGFAEGEAGLVGYRLAPNFRALGPRFGRDAQAVAAALRQAPAEAGRRARPQAAGRRAGRAGCRGAGHGRAGPRGGRGGRGAGDRLAGGPRRRHHGRPRPGGLARAAPGGAGPRPGPGRAGPAQERRAGRGRPDRAGRQGRRRRARTRSRPRSPPTATTCSARPWPPASTAPPRATATTPGSTWTARRSACGCARSGGPVASPPRRAGAGGAGGPGRRGGWTTWGTCCRRPGRCGAMSGRGRTAWSGWRGR